MYDPTIATELERRAAIEWMSKTIPLIRNAVLAVDPSLSPKLAKI